MTLKNKLFNRLTHHSAKRDRWFVEGSSRRYTPAGPAGPLVHTAQLPRK
ncbi:MAG: hypothetical protein ACRD0Z_12495 [Acidimicrobiales bacterium]